MPTFLLRRLWRWIGLATLAVAVSLSSASSALAQSTEPVLPPFAPPTPLRFEHLALEDGLSQNSVLAILQDQQGFLWFGTQDGLNRYDGYEFTVFKADPENPNSLSSNSIVALHQDRDGFIWVGTWGNGLNRLDPRTGQITRYEPNPDAPTTIGNGVVSAMLEDRAGRMWVGSMGGGLALLDRMTGQFTSYRHDPTLPESIVSDYVGVIYEDPAGSLWIGTGGFGTPGAGLDRFDPASGRFTHFQHDPTDPHSLSSDTISSLLTDRQGNLWVGTGGYGLPGAGLNLLDPATGQAQRYQHNETDPTTLGADAVMKIFQDNEGELWIGTWGGGLDRLVRKHEGVGFVHHRHDPFNPMSLSADVVWTMLEDHTGMLWIGTVNGGINKLNPQFQRFGLFRNEPDDPNSLGFDVVGGFYEDRSGGLWIGTWGGGLDYFDRAASAFTHYRHDPSAPGSLSDNTVSTIYEDESGAIWVGTFDGLNKLDRTTGIFTHFRHDPAEANTLVDNSVYALLPADAGRIWIATMGGLDLFDPQTEDFVHFRHDPNDPYSLPEAALTELYLSPDDVLWVGTWHHGIAYLDPDAWAAGKARFVRFQHNPDDPTTLGGDGAWAIHQDRRGNLWVGTENGLDKLAPATGRFTHYREPDGLPNNSVVCIQEDSQGNLWFSTNNGLVRLNPILMRFRTYDMSHGLQSNEFDSGACLRSRNGELYFGGIAGFNVFRPGEIRENPAPPPVVITGFRIFNRPAPVDLTGNTPVDLSYQENFIAFDFAALDYHAPKKNHYAYQLEGFDTEWQDAGTRRYAAYTNLPGGRYVFHVRGSNSDGVWNEAGVSIPLTVAPPIWETLWFRSILVGLAALLLAGGYWWRVSSIRAQNLRLEHKVTLQTAALRREIEQRKQAEAALAQTAANEAVVAERTRLARELHDAVTQTLFSASLIAEVLPELYATDAAEGQRSSDELRQLTRGALAEMRTLLLELRPSAVTRAQLTDLVRQLIEATTGRGRVPVQFNTEGQRNLPDDVKVAFYRIAQEALNNVVKYAKAKQVTVDLRQQPMGVRLTIGDDGLGFDPDAVGPGHHGQRIMRERAETIGARLAVHSEVGHGTLISLTWRDPTWNEPETPTVSQQNYEGEAP